MISKLLRPVKKPIAIALPWLPFKAAAMTLFPFIFFSKQHSTDLATWKHEMVHWKHQRKTGLLPWLVVYGILYIWYIWVLRKKIWQHPLETPGYRVQWRAWGWTEQDINSRIKYG